MPTIPTISNWTPPEPAPVDGDYDYQSGSWRRRYEIVKAKRIANWNERKMNEANTKAAVIVEQYAQATNTKRGLTFLTQLIARALVGVAMICVVHAAEVTVAWDANPEPEVNGYRLYVGTEPGVYTWSADTEGRTNTQAVLFLEPGTNYLAATAVTTNGIESIYSEPLRAVVPAAPTIRIVPK